MECPRPFRKVNPQSSLLLLAKFPKEPGLSPAASCSARVLSGQAASAGMEQPHNPSCSPGQQPPHNPGCIQTQA